MKRFLSVLMIMLLTVSLVACANSTDDTDSTTAPTTNIEAESVATAATTTAAQTAATTQTTASTQAPVQQQTTAEKTEWKPQIYTTAAPTTAKKDTYNMSELAMDKKTVGDTMKSPLSKSTYTLKWIDDFNGTSLNLNNWTVMTSNANASEGQANLAKNVKIANGKLSISMNRENVKDVVEGQQVDKKFTGGGIQSKGKQNFKYGRIEAYCKLPYGKGMWPAFWTIGDTIKGGREAWWPWGGEIDIMEMFGQTNELTTLSRGIFYYPMKDYENFDYSKAMSMAASDEAGFKHPKSMFSDGYHVYGIEWTPLKLTFYFDNMAWGSIDITGEDFKFAMHNYHQIIIHHAVEGFSRRADGSRGYDGREPNKDVVLPQTFDVDWVKVWQK